MRYPKTTALLSLVLLLLLNACAIKKDVIYNDPNDLAYIKQRVFSEAELRQLKATTTVFLYRSSDTTNLSQLKQTVQSIWHYTPIHFTTYDSIAQYTKPGYSLLAIRGKHVNVRQMNDTFTDNDRISEANGFSKDFTNSTNLVRPLGLGDDVSKRPAILKFFLTLSLITKKQQVEGQMHSYVITYSAIPLSLRESDQKELSMVKNYNRRNKVFGGYDLPDELMKKVYTTSNIKNWTPTHIGFFLTHIQHELETQFREPMYKTIRNEVALANLKTKTLLVPESNFDKMNIFTRIENKKFTDQSLFGKYTAPYKVVSTADLTALPDTTTELFLFDLVRNYNDFFIKIYSNKTGLVFQKYVTDRTNIRSTDIKQINK